YFSASTLHLPSSPTRRSSDLVYDYCLQIRKTPIVVNDSRGFFTTRVISTFSSEGLTMIAEGVSPVSVEQAAQQAGYPVGTLTLRSEEHTSELQSRFDLVCRLL